MDRDVERDMNWSTQAVTNLIWPQMKSACGYGQLIKVETKQDFASRQLDSLIGIDSWQLSNDKQMRGIASRVQQVDKPFPTFTVRYARNGGGETEYQKRLNAIHRHEHEGWLYPYLTLQGYVDMSHSICLAAALVRTKDLFLYIENEGLDTFTIKPTGNAKFIIVPWERLLSDGIPVKVYPKTLVNVSHIEIVSPQIIEPQFTVSDKEEIMQRIDGMEHTVMGAITFMYKLIADIFSNIPAKRSRPTVELPALPSLWDDDNHRKS